MAAFWPKNANLLFLKVILIIQKDYYYFFNVESNCL